MEGAIKLIYSIHPDTVAAIRKMYNMEKPGAMDEAIDIFEEWIKQQTHFLKKDFNRDYLERIIINAKGSVERAKENLDKMCTVRTALPQYFRATNIKEFEANKYTKIAAMPTLTEDHCRVTIIKSDAQTSNPKYLNEILIMICHYLEYSYLSEYGSGAILIFDYRGANLKECVTTLDINAVMNCQKIFLQGFSIRTKSVHYLTKSKMINALITIYNQFAPAKYANRTFVHEDLDTLNEHIEKQCLPIEYGGTGPSYSKLVDKYIDVLSSGEFMKHMKMMNAAKVDESLRQADAKNDEIFGTAGTFRNLQVD